MGLIKKLVWLVIIIVAVLMLINYTAKDGETAADDAIDGAEDGAPETSEENDASTLDSKVDEGEIPTIGDVEVGCVGGEVLEEYMCPDGTMVDWCVCDVEGDKRICDDSPEKACHSTEVSITQEDLDKLKSDIEGIETDDLGGLSE